MTIVSHKQIPTSYFSFNNSCDIFLSHVQVTDIQKQATEMITMLSDQSWISDLGILEEASYQARAQRTINYLITSVLSHIANTVSSEFGEFLVSTTAQNFLVTNAFHKKIPLAELFKEKVIGNPGFDFHTEHPLEFIAFGEAKYNAKNSPYTIAFEQIVSFIEKGKDIAELADLKHFVSKKSALNALANKKAFVAAFAINGKQPSNILQNALDAVPEDVLLQYPALYIIGIEIVS